MARVTKDLMNNLDSRSTGIGFGIKYNLDRILIRGDHILNRDDRIEPEDRIFMMMLPTGG